MEFKIFDFKKKELIYRIAKIVIVIVIVERASRPIVGSADGYAEAIPQKETKRNIIRK